jgi:hypothetical protein
VVHGAAADEERHYAWVEEVVERLGAGPDTLLGSAQQAAQAVQGRAADAVESAGRRVAETVERMRPGGAS